MKIHFFLPWGRVVGAWNMARPLIALRAPLPNLYRS
jgi:hypothetical protein